MQPLTPEERQHIRTDRPHVLEAEIDEYEQLLALQAQGVFNAGVSPLEELCQKRLRVLFKKLFGMDRELVIISLRGALAPMLRNPGSQSEHMGYGLTVAVEMETDKAFDYSSLTPYAGKQVTMVAKVWRGRLLGVSLTE